MSAIYLFYISWMVSGIVSKLLMTWGLTFNQCMFHISSPYTILCLFYCLLSLEQSSQVKLCESLHVQQVEGLLLCSAVTWAPFPLQALFLRMDACILVCAASQQWQKHPPSLLPAPVALFLSIHILLFAGRPGFLCDRDWWGLEFMFCRSHLVLHL